VAISVLRCASLSHMTGLLFLTTALLLSAPSSAATVRGEIQQQLDAYAEALKNKDVEKVMSFYEEDAIRIVPKLTMKGRVEIRAAIERIAKAEFKMQTLNFKTEDLRLMGDLAQEVGLLSGDNELPDGSHQRYAGRYLTIWHRGADGRWRIQADASFPESAQKR
jgi:uncharacterized protein (TIGR02246 family)